MKNFIIIAGSILLIAAIGGTVYFKVIKKKREPGIDGDSGDNGNGKTNDDGGDGDSGDEGNGNGDENNRGNGKRRDDGGFSVSDALDEFTEIAGKNNLTQTDLNKLKSILDKLKGKIDSERYKTLNDLYLSLKKTNSGSDVRNAVPVDINR